MVGSPWDLDTVLGDLDPAQRRAVTTESRLVAVIAGAGSGKTRVLTRRVAYRIVTGSAEPAHTLVLTFTREAAGELRRRLPRLGLHDGIAAGTFHSIAHGLLRQRWIDGDRRPPTVISDHRRLVAEIAGADDVDVVVSEISWAAARGLDAAQYRRVAHRPGVDTRRIADAIDRYADEKRRRGVVDLDDLLVLTIQAIERDPAFADVIRWRFRHLLVDEAQDLNPLQHRLVELVSAGSGDLFLVGDPAQSIYGFNGSDPALLAEVETRFPGVEVIRLMANHRCTPQVVEAGEHVLQASGQASGANSTRPDGIAVAIAAHPDAEAEATAIATRIARLDPGIVSGNRIAILGRTHAVLAPIRAALVARGVPVRSDPAGPGSAIAPVVAQAARNTGTGELRRWLHDALESAQDEPSGAPSIAVANAVLMFLREHPTGDGAGFRSWIGSNEPFGTSSNGVEILTFHGAKGREWHTVEIVGCETSLVPHRSATTVAARDEEARLLHVAVTRATDVLTINWARRRGGYQRRLSPLLDGFVASAPAVVAPPRAIVERPARATRDRHDLMVRLRGWRDDTARRAGTVPASVCTDHALAAIARHRPADAAELDAVTGMGMITANRLFPGLAAAIAGDSADV